MCSQLIKTTIFLTIGGIVLLVPQTHSLNITECMDFTEPQVCYHCDSEHDLYCANPFQYSHYYRLKEVYLTECEGCCIKIVHPNVNGSRRIHRSCTDLLPQDINFSLDENCDASVSERQICFCKRGLCNSVNSVLFTTNDWLIIIGLIKYFLCNYFNYFVI